MNAPQSNGILINGKAQMIEMLQFMNVDERNRILKNVREKNPALAEELNEQSLTFGQLEKLPDNILQIVSNKIDPSILGIALKDSSVDFQRRILSLCPRDLAGKAYEILISNIPNEKEYIKKARQKIIATMVLLSKKGIISI